MHARIPESRRPDVAECRAARERFLDEVCVSYSFVPLITPSSHATFLECLAEKLIPRCSLNVCSSFLAVNFLSCPRQDNFANNHCPVASQSVAYLPGLSISISTDFLFRAHPSQPSYSLVTFPQTKLCCLLAKLHTTGGKPCAIFTTLSTSDGTLCQQSKVHKSNLTKPILQIEISA